MLLSWKGPYEVVEIVSPVNCKLNVDGLCKTFHFNLLKKYETREETDKISASSLVVGSVGVVAEADEGTQEFEDKSNEILTPSIVQSEFIGDVHICDSLSEQQQSQAQTLINDFHDVFTDVPSKTNVLCHDITLTTDTPVFVKQYPLPYSQRDTIIKETQSMLSMGIIERSVSDYCSPVVLVKKKDGSVRFCIDYRKLNSVTVSDAEPIPNQEELLTRIGNARFFTKIDLTKGYWQVPLTDECKKYTAFQTPLGLFHFMYMPFGLVTAPMTFARLMSEVLCDVPNVIHYFDDILIYNELWNHHLSSVRDVLSKLRQAGLSARPTKSFVGFQSIEFLGHVVGTGVLQPDPKKVEKMLSLRNPRTKKEVRSVLGLLGYYRKFVPHFASLSVPLSNLTKKGSPDRVPWDDVCQQAFDEIKKILSTSPILILPDLTSKFFLRTDASETGLGAALLQERDGLLHPVHFASKKFLEREMRYSVVERECLGIVFGVDHYSKYLILTPFELQSDHEPLTFLKKNASKNARLMRWSLKLQEYNFTVTPIPGTENCLADILSRLHE